MPSRPEKNVTAIHEEILRAATAHYMKLGNKRRQTHTAAADA
jgi:hypothetical protein